MRENVKVNGCGVLSLEHKYINVYRPKCDSYSNIQQLAKTKLRNKIAFINLIVNDLYCSNYWTCHTYASPHGINTHCAGQRLLTGHIK